MFPVLKRYNWQTKRYGMKVWYIKSETDIISLNIETRLIEMGKWIKNTSLVLSFDVSIPLGKIHKSHFLCTTLLEFRRIFHFFQFGDIDWDNGEWLDLDSWWNKGGDSWNLGGEADEEVGDDLRLSTEVVKLEASPSEAAWVEAATTAVMMADVDVPPPVPIPWFCNALDCSGTPKD